jgi:chromosome segregation ATPase
MNSDRRKRLDVIMTDLEKLNGVWDEIQHQYEELSSKVEEFSGGIADAKQMLEGVKDEEYDAFENLSEGLQQGDRGRAMSAAIGEMEDALGMLDDMNVELELPDPDIDSVITALDSAKAQ